MEQEYATLLTPAWNHAVVQLPGRRFPGVVFQGDSLFLLLEQVREVREALDAGRLDEAKEGAAELEDDLAGVLSGYESVLAARGIELPYFKKPR
jgi:hypothetical protein